MRKWSEECLYELRNFSQGILAMLNQHTVVGLNNEANFCGFGAE